MEAMLTVLSRKSPYVTMLKRDGVDKTVEVLTTSCELLINVSGLLAGLMFVILTQEFEFSDTSVTQEFGLSTGLSFVFGTFSLILFVSFYSRLHLMTVHKHQKRYIETYCITVDMASTLLVLSIVAMLLGCSFALQGFYSGTTANICLFIGAVLAAFSLAFYIHNVVLTTPWILDQDASASADASDLEMAGANPGAPSS